MRRAAVVAAAALWLVACGKVAADSDGGGGGHGGSAGAAGTGGHAGGGAGGGGGGGRDGGAGGGGRAGNDGGASTDGRTDSAGDAAGCPAGSHAVLCPGVACTLACGDGFQRGTDGCPVCACRAAAGCAGLTVQCRACPFGYRTPSAACASNRTCDCEDPPLGCAANTDGGP